MPLPVSVLDLVGMRPGETPGPAIARSADLARHAEQWGFRRFWLAEHHSIEGLACSATPVLIGHVAGATSTIRVGSGGVMLPNHAPLVVAEQFGTLEALHPGRIDLGIGRAPGTDQLTALALRRTMEGLSAENFPAELLDLIRLFTGGDAPARITATPGLGDMPAIWLLGSSGYSAQLAGLLGLPFSFAHHFSSANTVPTLTLYRENFRPSQWLEHPYAMVAVNAICADTDERAEWLAGPAALSFLRLRSGRPQPLASPEEAAAYPYAPGERDLAWGRFADQALGSPDTVRAQLAGLLECTGADELMLTTMVYDIADRIRSFELITEKVAAGLRRS